MKLNFPFLYLYYRRTNSKFYSSGESWTKNAGNLRSFKTTEQNSPQIQNKNDPNQGI